MRRFLPTLFTALSVLATLGNVVGADWHHPMALDGGQYWRQRICVKVHNGQNASLEGRSVALPVGVGPGQAQLTGQSAQSVRVVDHRGAEMLFAVRTPAGELVTQGPIADGSTLVLPAECPAQTSATYYVYFDNPAAGEVPDYLTELPNAAKNDGVAATAEKPEKCVLQEKTAVPGWDASLPAGVATPDRRLTVRVFNFSDKPSDKQLASLDVTALAVRSKNRIAQCALLLDDQGRPVPFYTTGERIFFEADVPSRTARTWYFDAWDQPQGGLSQPSDSGQPLLDRFNRVKNPSFESGQPMPDNWTCATDPPHSGITAGLDDPGRADFGHRCVRLHVPADAPRQWRGWRQAVPVKPGKTYLLRAWVKSRDVQGSVHVYVHLLTASGALCKENAMGQIGPPIPGTSDWSMMSGTLTMPADAAALEIHLTIDQPGTLWHDQLALLEVVSANAGSWEGRPLAPSDGLRVWPVPAVVKVFPDDPAPSQAAAASIGMARNEKEPLQLAIRTAQSLTGVHIDVDPPVGPDGAKLEQCAIHVVGYVPIDHATSYYHSETPAWQRKFPTRAGGCDGWPGWWPDPLLPRDVLDLAANQTGAVWVTVAAAKDQRPGAYTGRVRLLREGRTLSEVPFTVRVWNFALPEKSHVIAQYDVRFGPGGHYWGMPLEKAYAQVLPFMSANRLCPDAVQPSPKIRYENGKVIADYAEFDRAAEYYFDELGLPHSYTPWLFYGFGWGHPPKDFFGEHPYPGQPPYTDADRSQLRPEYKKAYQTCLKAFWDHIKAKGWEKKFILYLSDEPFYTQEPIREQMKALCRMIHEVDPKIPIYSSTWHHVPDWDGYLNIWGIGHFGVVTPEKMAQLRAAGGRIWFTTDGHMCTDTPYCAIERLLPHYCFKYGADAYEFWGVSWLTYDPYRFGWHAYIPQSESPGHHYWIRYPNGDGFLLYPGKPIGHDGPVSSVRFEQAREGVEDYEYLFLLKQKIDRAKAAGANPQAAEAAMQQVQQLISVPNAGGRYSSKILPDPQALYDARQAVAEAIESLPGD